MDNIVIQEMTAEDVENLYREHEIRSRIAGFGSIEEMESFKVDASLGMIKFGGSFTEYLGHALAHADSSNTMKLIRAFRDVCEEHARLYRQWRENRSES